MTQAYPLQWPAGWPRTPFSRKENSKYRFRKPRASKSQDPFWTFAEARDALLAELERLGARNVVLSSNYQTRLDGLPRSRQAAPSDTGIAVYFTLKGRQQVMACDMHIRAEENMRSLALAIEAMRQLERHGGGVMMERAFVGFAALPPPREWHEILGVSPTATADEINSAFRARAKTAHPDAGGDPEEFTALQRAREMGLKKGGDDNEGRG